MHSESQPPRTFGVLSVDFGVIHTEVLHLVHKNASDVDFDIQLWESLNLIDAESLDECSDAFTEMMIKASERFADFFRTRRLPTWNESRVPGFFCPPVDAVALELQPVFNTKTTILSHNALQFCKLILPPSVQVYFIPASAKRQFWRDAGFSLDREYKSEYRRNKRESIEFARQSLAPLPQWEAVFEAKSKKDDGADVLNAGRAALKNLLQNGKQTRESQAEQATPKRTKRAPKKKKPKRARVNHGLRVSLS